MGHIIQSCGQDRKKADPPNVLPQKRPPFARGGGKDAPMSNNDRDYWEKQVKEEAKSALELIIREGACRMHRAFLEKIHS